MIGRKSKTSSWQRNFRDLPDPHPRLLEVLYQDQNLLAVNKPAGLVCHPTKGAPFSSLIGRLRLFLAGPAPRAPRLIHRLDRETSGVVLAALNPEAAGELGRIWERRLAEKEYLALVHGHVKDDSGAIDAPLGRDAASPVAIKDCVRPDGAAARTLFRVERRFTRAGQPYSLVQARPLTGRKHQIRIHLAWLGHPVVGDKIYGGDPCLYLDFVKGRLTERQRQQLVLPFHALHSRMLRFPWRGNLREFVAPPPPWLGLWACSEQACPTRPASAQLRNSGQPGYRPAPAGGGRSSSARL